MTEDNSKKPASKFKDKTKQGFDTKWRIYLFKLALEGKSAEELAFDDFNLNEKIIHRYVAQYHQYETDEIIENNSTVDHIYEKMQDLEKQLSKAKEQHLINYSFGKEKLKDAFDAKVNEAEGCSYCGITLDQIDTLAQNEKIKGKAQNRRYSLEIDRIAPNQEYLPDNIAMSCYWCNNAKTDEFTKEEFKPIAMGIRQVWVNRLKEIEAFKVAKNCLYNSEES